MTVRVPAVGQRLLLRTVLREELELRLHSNIILDLGSLTEADFEEPTAEGYAPKVLVPGFWREEESSWPVAMIYREPQAFVFRAAAGILRGYFVTHRATGRLAWYEPFPKFQNARRRGDRVTVTPRLTAHAG